MLTLTSWLTLLLLALLLPFLLCIYRSLYGTLPKVLIYINIHYLHQSKSHLSTQDVVPEVII